MPCNGLAVLGPPAWDEDESLRLEAALAPALRRVFAPPRPDEATEARFRAALDALARLGRAAPRHGAG